MKRAPNRFQADLTMTESLTFSYTNNAETARVTREWEKLDSNTVREVDREEMKNHQTGEWEEVREHTRTLETTESGLLVGDGSNWDGDGMPWYEYAEQRHNKRLELRFPYDFGKNEPQKSGRDVAKELIAANY